MHPITISVIGLATANLSFAQNTTSTIFLPELGDQQILVVSSMDADATATTWAVQCAPWMDSSDCGVYGRITLTEEAERARVTWPAELDENGELRYTGYFDCTLASTTVAICTESFGGKEANFPGKSTETYSGTDIFLPVIVTDRLMNSDGEWPTSTVSPTTGAPPAATTSAAANTSKASTAASIGLIGSGGSGAAETTPSSTATSAAGVPAITGNAKWGLAGIAAAAMLVI